MIKWIYNFDELLNKLQLMDVQFATKWINGLQLNG